MAADPPVPRTSISDDKLDKTVIEATEKALPAASEELALGTAEKTLASVSKKSLPTDEELATLRHVPGSIPWIIIPIAFVEMCERISYCGTVVVCSSPHPSLQLL